MSTGVVAVSPEESAKTALTRMRQHRIRHLVVVDRSHVVGIVSERDLGGRKVAEPRGARTVRDLMTAGRPVSVSPATTLRQAANLMRGHTIGSLIVVEKDKLVGLVTTTDLLDQLGHGATRPTVRIEPPPVRRAPGAGRVRGKGAIRVLPDRDEVAGLPAAQRQSEPRFPDRCPDPSRSREAERSTYPRLRIFVS